MPIDIDVLRSLPAQEKLELIEMLWDALGAPTEAIPLPEWVDQEANRRRAEMADPSFGLTHEEVCRRIEHRKG
ncbi:MAG: addiction module protein [Pirellulales bacterium]